MELTRRERAERRNLLKLRVQLLLPFGLCAPMVIPPTHIFAPQEVPEHIVFAEDLELWRDELHAGALNPEGPFQAPRLKAGLALPAGPGRMCSTAPDEALIAGQGFIFKVLPEDITSYFAGSAEMTGYQDGTAESALFGLELSIGPDGEGGLYVSDRFNRCIRRIHHEGGQAVGTPPAGDP